MQKEEIGRTSLQGSRLVWGCMRMAERSQEEVASLLDQVIDLGFNFFDHADIYAGGESERLFGQAWKASGHAREELIIQSKCGIRQGYYDFSQEHILASVEGSLDRLQTDYLDFLLLHRPDALMEPDQVAQAFDKLHQSGKVRYFGVSNFSPNQIELLNQALDSSTALQVNQIQFGPAHTLLLDEGLQFNMKTPSGMNPTDGLLAYSQAHQITLQAWSPFQVDLDQGLIFNHPDYQDLTQTLEDLADHYGVTKEAILVAWILRHPAQIQPIIGSMNSERLEGIAQADRIQLTHPEWYQIYRSAGNDLP